MLPVCTFPQVFGVATRPIQLLSFSLDNGAESTISAVDLEDLFPRYYGALALDVVAVSPALPNTAVVFDADNARLLLTNVAAGTVQEIHLPIEPAGGVCAAGSACATRQARCECVLQGVCVWVCSSSDAMIFTILNRFAINMSHVGNTLCSKNLFQLIPSAQRPF